LISECPMFDFGGSPVFIFVPFIAFSVIFLLIILLKSCVVMSRSDLQRGWATQIRRTRRPMNSHSTASVEIQTSHHSGPIIPPPAPPPYPPPPSYSQIQNFPELPTVSNARLDTRTPSRNGKKSEITPVE
ncbi:hypothetical protein GCK32_006951, partial [Trichostrongylus colubriformis]